MLDTTESHVVILIEHSSATTAHLPSLTGLILNYLKSRIVSAAAVRSRAFHFNVGRYDKDVHFWQDEPVTCTETAVRKVGDWLRADEFAPSATAAHPAVVAGASVNVLGAVLAAFVQPNVDAVYLAAASVSDTQSTHELLDNIRHAARSRPVHVLHIESSLGGIDGEHDRIQLQMLAKRTGGTFQTAGATGFGIVSRPPPTRTESRSYYREAMEDALDGAATYGPVTTFRDLKIGGKLSLTIDLNKSRH